MPQYCIELGCDKHASYNYPGAKGRITCKKHHLYGMVNSKEHPKCRTPDCEKYAAVNCLCVSCARKNGVEGVIRTKCKTPECEKQAYHGLDGYCISCFNEIHGIIRNPDLNTFKIFLKNKFPEFYLKTEFDILCFRIDFLFELEELFFAIEYDQNQHKWKYPPEKEAKREEEILEKLMEKKRTVFIRFNPSNYRIGGKLQKTSLEKRFEKLGEFIEECISDQTKSGIFRLFYDE